MKEVRRFTSDDLNQMESWYKDRGLPIPPINLLPEVGFIVDDTAAGFLYITGGNQLGFMDGFITSQQASYIDRQKGLDVVTKALIDEAKERKVLKLLAFTTAQVIFDRAITNGFDFVDKYFLLSKSLD